MFSYDRTGYLHKVFKKVSDGKYEKGELNRFPFNLSTDPTHKIPSEDKDE